MKRFILQLKSWQLALINTMMSLIVSWSLSCLISLIILDRVPPISHIIGLIVPLFIAPWMSLFHVNMIHKIHALEEELRQQASRDYLTGLYNRRAFIDIAESQIHLTSRNKTMISLLYIDIDHFKKINDQYSHMAGDAVLRQFGNLLSSSIRCSDTLSRMGGEEFCLLLPETNQNGALNLSEKIRAKCEDFSYTYGDQTISATISIGIRTVQPNNDYKLDALIRDADNALYQSKNQGRNRATLFTSTD